MNEVRETWWAELSKPRRLQTKKRNSLNLITLKIKKLKSYVWSLWKRDPNIRDNGNKNSRSVRIVVLLKNIEDPMDDSQQLKVLKRMKESLFLLKQMRKLRNTWILILRQDSWLLILNWIGKLNSLILIIKFKSFRGKAGGIQRNQFAIGVEFN